MDKFQKWIARKDVEWVKHVGIFYLFNIQLSPIRPLVKEFLQATTCFNSNIVESIIQGILVFITKKTMAKMLCLLQSDITKIRMKPQKEKKEKGKEKESIIYQKIAPLKALMEWEGWKVFLLKGMYVARLLALMQVI